ncbi:hypothetical protein CH371_12385 [Leptospira wolffii]|uniref:Uncharacterized protein n=1 Tax=Leptospira wolffii TaxID=409998 RepID=A0A2M9ZBB3_9LEPT|nr:hypothetical protein CH371_12385 [Leptospira wolffii]
MKLILIIVVAYFVFRFIRTAFFPQETRRTEGFRVIFPDSEETPREKDISDKGRVLGKGE